MLGCVLACLVVWVGRALAWCVAMVAGAARLAGVAWLRWPGRGRLGTSGDVWRCLGGGVGWWVAAPGRWHLVEVDLGGPAGRESRYLAGHDPGRRDDLARPLLPADPGTALAASVLFRTVNSVIPGIDFWWQACETGRVNETTASAEEPSAQAVRCGPDER